MSRRVIVKKKKPSAQFKGKNINDIFNEILGLENAEPDILIPKFVKIRNLTRHLYKIFKQIAGLNNLRTSFPIIVDGLDELSAFADKLYENICFNLEQKDTVEQYQKLNKDDVNTLYKKLTTNKYIRMLIVLCGKLNQYKKCISDEEALKDNFILQEPGNTFMPFSTIGSSIDLKVLWYQDNITDNVKNFFLIIISKIYTDTHEIYKIATSPNVNVEKFADVIMDAIKKLKKQPELSRCKNAFRQIEQSVDLLKNNFDTYYRGGIASNNLNVIMESFVIDVSTKCNFDASLTLEFRKIITYMQKVSQQNGKGKNKDIQNLFSVLEKNMTMMEQCGNEKSSEDKATIEVLDGDNAAGNAATDAAAGNAATDATEKELTHEQVLDSYGEDLELPKKHKQKRKNKKKRRS